MFYYTYRLRGFSIGCQPKGLLNVINDKLFKYEIISYSKELTEKQMNDYELVKVNKCKCGKFYIPDEVNIQCCDCR